MLGIALAFALIGPRFLGGWSVLRRRDQLHLAMGFAGGALLGVAIFDTLPEAIELFGRNGQLAAAAAAAFGAVTFRPSRARSSATSTRATRSATRKPATSAPAASASTTSSTASRSARPSR